MLSLGLRAKTSVQDLFVALDELRRRILAHAPHAEDQEDIQEGRNYADEIGVATRQIFFSPTVKSFLLCFVLQTQPSSSNT